jgi:hypothetical protein
MASHMFQGGNNQMRHIRRGMSQGGMHICGSTQVGRWISSERSNKGWEEVAGRKGGNVILPRFPGVLDCRRRAIMHITLGGKCALQAESRVDAKASQGLKQCRGTNVVDHMEITHWPRALGRERGSLRCGILPATNLWELCFSVPFCGFCGCSSPE